MRFTAYSCIFWLFHRIETDLKGRGRECVDWVDLAWDRDNLRAVLNAVTNCRSPQNAWNLFFSSGIVSYSKQLCFMELVS